MTTPEELAQEAKRLAVAYAEACAESAVDVGSARSHQWGAHLATPERALFASIDALAKRAAELEADRDSWERQASDRVDDAVAFAKRAAELERLLRKARANIWVERQAVIESHSNHEGVLDADAAEWVSDFNAQLEEIDAAIDAAIASQDKADMDRLTANGAKAWADVQSAADWVDQIRGNDQQK